MYQISWSYFFGVESLWGVKWSLFVFMWSQHHCIDCIGIWMIMVLYLLNLTYLKINSYLWLSHYFTINLLLTFKTNLFLKNSTFTFSSILSSLLVLVCWVIISLYIVLSVTKYISEIWYWCSTNSFIFDIHKREEKSKHQRVTWYTWSILCMDVIVSYFLVWLPNTLSKFRALVIIFFYCSIST